jgi:hypothetical protein
MNPDNKLLCTLESISLENWVKWWSETEKINELNAIMNNIKINNQATMHSAVRNKQYIIGSYVDGTGVSFNATPTVQYSLMQARSECRRLAKLYPGKTFFFVKLEGGEMTVPQPQSVSI